MKQKRVIQILAMLLISINSHSQSNDSTKPVQHFGGTITATQNGISLIPSFSLNRPAVMFDFNMGGKKLSFEPLLRFGLDGKPWAFVFWFRYKVVTGNKFKMSIGAHPSYVFRSIANPPVADAVQVSRFVAIDFTPTYSVAKNIHVGVYGLFSRGIDKSSVRYTHFITLNTNFTHLKIAGRVYAKFNPQVYYLNMAGSDGFYFTHSLTLVHEKFPVSLQTIMNKSIQTEIAGNSFVWNLSLIYSFNKNYTSRQ